MRREYLFAITLLGLLTAHAGEAKAAPQLLPESQTSKGGADINWLSTKGAGSTFALVPFVQYELTSKIYLKAQVPIAININGPYDKDYAGFGNPTLAVHYAATSGKFSGYIGGRIGIPLATVHSSGWQQAVALGNYATAEYDLHLWLPKYLPVGAYGGVEYLALPFVMLRGELAPQLIIPIEDTQYRGVKTRFVYTGRVEVEARAECGFGGGAAFQWWGNPSGFGDAIAQNAAEGFASYDDGELFGRLGLLVALDKPDGFGFDKGKVATLHGRIGGRF